MQREFATPPLSPSPNLAPSGKKSYSDAYTTTGGNDMKKHVAIAMSILSSVALGTLATASPASAATLLARCNTTGASGGSTVPNFGGATDKISVTMSVDDTLADGHHAKIRLLTKNVNGTIKYWQWHRNDDGAGTSKTWNTTATESTGIFSVGVQVARGVGDTVTNSCTAWSIAN
jgi:hypothetical protein